MLLIIYPLVLYGLECRPLILREEHRLKAFRIFEVFTAVTMKNGVFWDFTPCGSHGVTSYKTPIFLE
jgi:hypothetical protein